MVMYCLFFEQSCNDHFFNGHVTPFLEIFVRIHASIYSLLHASFLLSSIDELSIGETSFEQFNKYFMFLY